jgi:hypothetical protein
MRRGPQVNPSKVYYDPGGCKRGHDPCVRWLASCKCLTCEKESTGRGVFAEADRVCPRCGCYFEEGHVWGGKGVLCKECASTDPKWDCGTTFLCVEGDKPFIGGHYRKEQMAWSLILESWDLGMVFEEWRGGKYFCSWRVVPNTANRPVRDVLTSWREGHRPPIILELVDRQPKGDGRILKP